MRIGRINFYFLSYVTYMNDDGVFSAECAVVPYVFVNLFRRKNTVKVFHKQLKNGVFGWSEVNLIAVNKNLFGNVVNQNASVAKILTDGSFAQLKIASELRFGSCNNLNGVERLGYVVVGSDIKTEYFVVVLTFCRYKDNGNIVFFFLFQSLLQCRPSAAS